jgi:lipopolysaccharide export system permease protein
LPLTITVCLTTPKSYKSNTVIIFRYLTREILASTFAICTVLLMVLISGRFVKYLSNALAGNLEPSVIFAVIGYKIPGFLELALPLAFFLSILLTFGRLHIENEMSVLKACGISELRLLGYTFIVAVGLAILVGWLSLFVSPAGATKTETIFLAQQQMTELDKVNPKKFYSLKGGKGVTYADSISSERELEDVFLAVSAGSVDTFNRRLAVVVAERGRQQQSEDGIERFLVLEKGYRIEGIPGSHEYQITHFEEYGSKLKTPKKIEEDPETDAIATSELLMSDDPKLEATLQWRLSIPLMVLIVVILAVPLSRTDPRQGRFTKLLPAIALYFAYLLALNTLRGNIESGELPVSITLLPVHAVFLLLGLWLLKVKRLTRRKVKDVAAGQSS